MANFTAPGQIVINYHPFAARWPSWRGDFDLHWDAFPGGTEDDFIRFFVVENGGIPPFKLWWYPYPVFEEWPGYDATAVNIFAGALEPGRTYLGVLQFIRVVDVNEEDHTHAFGQTLVSAQTVFNLATASAAPTLNQPERLSATQFRLLLTGLAGQLYAVEKSTNLDSTNWSVLFITNAPAIVVDQSATNSSSFYRARALGGADEQ